MRPLDSNPIAGVTHQTSKQPMGNAGGEYHSDLCCGQIPAQNIGDSYGATGNAHIEPPSHPTLNVCVNVHLFS